LKLRPARKPDLPAGWDQATVAAIALSTEKATPLPTRIENGKAMASVRAQQPAMLYREGEKGKKRLLSGFLKSLR
jgi:hypothetical protein